MVQAPGWWPCASTGVKAKAHRALFQSHVGGPGATGAKLKLAKIILRTSVGRSTKTTKFQPTPSHANLRAGVTPPLSLCFFTPVCPLYSCHIGEPGLPRGSAAKVDGRDAVTSRGQSRLVAPF